MRERAECVVRAISCGITNGMNIDPIRRDSEIMLNINKEYGWMGRVED